MSYDATPRRASLPSRPSVLFPCRPWRPRRPRCPLAPRLLLSGLILLLGLLVTNYWYQAQLIEENVEIDAAVLTGELPIDAYLDKGFGAWLKSSLE